mgnify:CR=1 FL=1
MVLYSVDPKQKAPAKNQQLLSMLIAITGLESMNQDKIMSKLWFCCSKIKFRSK